MAIQDFDPITIGARVPVTQDFLQKMHDRDEALLSYFAGTYFVAVNVTSASYVSVASVPVFVNPGVIRAAGTMAFVFHFQIKGDAGGTQGKVRIRLGGGAWHETATLTPGTTYVNQEEEIDDAALKALSPTIGVATLDIEALMSSGVSIDVKCTSSASRFERRT